MVMAREERNRPLIPLAVQHAPAADSIIAFGSLHATDTPPVGRHEGALRCASSITFGQAQMG